MRRSVPSTEETYMTANNRLYTKYHIRVNSLKMGNKVKWKKRGRKKYSTVYTGRDSILHIDT